MARAVYEIRWRRDAQRYASAARRRSGAVARSRARQAGDARRGARRGARRVRPISASSAAAWTAVPRTSGRRPLGSARPGWLGRDARLSRAACGVRSAVGRCRGAGPAGAGARASGSRGWRSRRSRVGGLVAGPRSARLWLRRWGARARRGRRATSAAALVGASAADRLAHRRGSCGALVAAAMRAGPRNGRPARSALIVRALMRSRHHRSR